MDSPPLELDASANPVLDTSANPILTNLIVPSRIRLIAPARPRPRPNPNPNPNPNPSPPVWEQRCKTIPPPGTIRFLHPAPPLCFDPFLWAKDLTLTEWIQKLNQSENASPIAAAFRPPNYTALLRALFEAQQRKRWLARIVVQRWTQRVWRRRTQCNIDMIDMQPVADKDAVFMTDTAHRTVFRFHRNDVFQTLLTNLSMSDEFFPTPRAPTNPWTNAKLTLAQTIGICEQLAAEYGRRCRSPPVLFAAFWASRFTLKRFQEENSSLLAQNAITQSFSDLNEMNQPLVFDTITNLLSIAGLTFSSFAIRKWLRQTPVSPLHREWLKMARDYTLYINLHVQVRAHWHTEDRVYRDVRLLYERTIPLEAPSRRMTLLRSVAEAVDFIPPPMHMFGLLGLPSILHPLLDISGGLTESTVIELIRNAPFR